VNLIIIKSLLGIFIRLPTHLCDDILRWNLGRLPTNGIREFSGHRIADIAQPPPSGLLGATTHFQQGGGMKCGRKTKFSSILGLQQTLTLCGGHRKSVAEIIIIRGIRGAGHVSQARSFDILREIANKYGKRWQRLSSYINLKLVKPSSYGFKRSPTKCGIECLVNSINCIQFGKSSAGNNNQLQEKPVTSKIIGSTHKCHVKLIETPINVALKKQVNEL